MDTETIDRLFLELSQFTTAITKREIELRELNAELLGILKHIISSYELTDSDLSESESAIAKAEKLVK